MWLLCTANLCALCAQSPILPSKLKLIPSKAIQETLNNTGIKPAQITAVRRQVGYSYYLASIALFQWYCQASGARYNRPANQSAC